ncbi:MAG: starch-binding protein, partial [Oscillospiraceae bacterium]|nr:starch-binding protein [Oscillospiraceae bacterium]
SSHKWANHAITVVGWDDSISKSNFKPNTPSGNGAWLCKNSWGTGYFNSGYMWISYEDTSVREGYIYFYDAESIDNYDHNYQYDGSCNVVTYGIGNRTGFANNTKVANIFTATGSQVLKAVALCNWDEALEYTIQVYKNPTSTPDSGTLMSTQTGTLTFSGYYTIPLDTPVSLANGDKFAIVVNQYVPVADDAGKYVHTPYDANFNDSSLVSWASWTHVNHGNTSYYKEPNGSWTDCPDNGDYRIKAFTDDVTFNLTAVSNNNSWGTVAVNGSTINCTPANGYYVESCTVLSGTATCTINGNTVTVAAEADCTVQVNFAVKPQYTVNFVASGVAEGSQTALVQDVITLPGSVSNTAAGWTFVGWMNQQIDETTDKPEYYAPGASYTVTGNATLYAVYTRVEAGTGGLYYELVTAAQDDWSGRYVITYTASASSMYVMKGVTPSSNGSQIESTSNCSTYAASGVTLNDDTKLYNVANNYIFVFEPQGSYYSVKNLSTNTYLGLATNSYLAAYIGYNSSYCNWMPGNGTNAYGMKNAGSGSYPYLNFSTNSRYFWTSSSDNSSIRLWKETNDSTTYYWTDPVAAEHEHVLEHVEAVAPTCGTEGHSDYYRCTVCGKYFSDAAGEIEISLADTVIPATGEHSWGGWTKNNNGTHSRSCSVCNETETESCSYQDELVEPTATEQGYTLHTCTVCGYSFKDSYVDPLGEEFEVHFSVPAGVTKPADMVSNTNTGITLPTVEGPEGYEFLGWVLDDYDNVETRPSLILSGNYVAPQEITLKALFTYVDGEGSGETVYQRVENPMNGGKYILVADSSVSNTTGYAVGNSVMSAGHYLTPMAVTINDELCVASDVDAVLWEVASVTNGFTFYNAVTGKYMGLDSAEYLNLTDTALAWAYTGDKSLDNQIDSEQYYYLSYSTASNSNPTRYTTGKSSTSANYVIRLYEQTVAGAVIYTTIIGENPVDVYFVDQDGNANAYVYAFGNGNENAAFPGEQMTPMGVDEHGDNWYKVTVDRNTYTNVIFSGGDASTQTANLGLGDGEYVIYYVNNHTGYQGADIWPAPAVEVEATCTEAGSITYTGMFTDEEHVTEIAALGHDFGEWAVTTPATCTEAGVETRSCSRCDAVETRPVDALGHKSAAAVKENEVLATCTAAGSYDMVVYCERCGAELSREHFATEQLPHTPGETVIENETAATCTAEGGYDEVVSCTVCGNEISRTHVVVDALGHNFGEWAVTTPATCTEAGVETRSCSRCDATETRPVDALGHLAGEAVEENRVEPTATTEGGYDTVVYCQRCGIELSREHTVLPATMNGYFLIGPNGWTVDDIDENNVFTVNPANANEYLLSITLTEGDPIKVVHVTDGAIDAWYPEGTGNEYIVDAAHAGEKTIYFKTNYDNAWADFGGYFYIEANPVGPTDPILENNFVIYSSATIGIEVYATFGVRKNVMQSYDSWYIEVKKLDKDGTVTESKRFGAGQDGEIQEGYICNAKYTDITAKEFGVTMEVSVHAFEANGQEHYSAPVSYTMQEYIIDELLKADNSVAMRALAADLLNYGAAAQVYFDYETEHLVNHNLSTEAQAAMDQFASTGEAPADLVNGSNGPNVYGSVSVKNRIVLSMTVRGMSSYETMKVRIKNHEDGSVKDTIDAKKRGSVWVADYDGFEAEDMRTLYDFVPVADGEETGTPLTWSVEGYAREARLNPDATAAELKLFNALLHYVDAVKAAFPS